MTQKAQQQMATTATDKPRKARPPRPAEELSLEKQLGIGKDRTEAEIKAADKLSDEQRASLKKRLGQLRFIRLAEGRVNAALKAIANLANLAGPGYEYDDELIDEIESAMNETWNNTMNRLRGVKGTKAKFTFGKPSDNGAQ